MHSIEKILEKLQEGAEHTSDLLKIAMSGKSGYIREVKRSSRYGPQRFEHDWAEWYRQRQAVYSLLNQLKRDQLVTKKETAHGTLWKITKMGLQKLKKKPKRHPSGIVLKKYKKETARKTIIISYDIPERMGKKRYWLRESLAALNFSLLQKSVWVGTTQIPKEFVDDLRTQRLLPYIHIFSIDRHGTMTKTN